MKKFLYCLFIFFSQILGADAQQDSNIFSVGNTVIYADYLYRQNRIQESLNEYRSIFGKGIYADSLVEKYTRISLQSLESKNSFNQLTDYVLKPSASTSVKSAYFNLLCKENDFATASKYFNPPAITASEINLKFRFYMMKMDKDSSSFYYQHLPEEMKATYSPVYCDFIRAKYKNPYLASCLSAAIPGTGKVYASDWKNGLVSFLSIACSGLIAYEAFRIKGISSGLGWVYAGVGLGLYGGGIYGACRSAQKFNQTQKTRLRNEMEKVFFAE